MTGRHALPMVGLLILPLAACGGSEPGVANGSTGSSPTNSGVAAAVAGPAAAQSAGLHCAEPAFNFGSIWEGQIVEHTFELVAAGDAPVKVEAVRTTCGCTIPRLSRSDGRTFVEGQTLEPGEGLSLNVRFSSLQRTGTHDRPVTLYGNVSPEGRYQVKLTGVVQPRLQANQEVAEMGTLLRSETARAEVELVSADGEPVLLLPPRPPGGPAGNSVAPWPAELGLQLVPEDPDQRGRSAHWTAVLELSAGGESAAFHWPVRIEIADEDGDYTSTGATIYARWNRVRPVESMPRALALGVLRQGVLKSASVRLVAHSEDVDLAGLDVAGATIEAAVQGQEVGEFLQLVLRPGETSAEANLELVVDGLPSGLTGPLRGRVLLPLGREDQEFLEVRLDGVIAAG
ncbi:DUF1573 domain-containing protein [Engelhardtia mirabilis]|uniref:DUF1573 domain-containing protein n=1 Tax=Engelhardtia mirabilis TaxID=2528011 RepID=A0A518BJ56_9BACT|nr:hypothetical protein Pla133_20790 [Planctomycetes bacterium Pla133]QDV01329.1 hypothetical protein Pla86_20790 [Planctomycetes bacterium Pla86]